MEITKRILKEELTIFNERLKLTKETLILIENQDYVKYVLGITIPLNESQSYETQKLILKEALNVQDLAKAIVQKVGEKVNTVVTGVKDLNDLSRIIYSIITDKSGTLAEKALGILKGELTNAVNRITYMINNIITKAGSIVTNIKNLLDPITTHLKTLSQKILSGYNGIAGILIMLGLATAIIWAEQELLNFQIDKIADWIKKGTTNLLTKLFNSYGNFFKDVFGNLALNDILSFFSDFDLGPIVQSAKIISIMAMLLQPVVQRFNLRKDFNPQQA